MMADMTRCGRCWTPLRPGDPLSFGICERCMAKYSPNHPDSIRYRKAMIRCETRMMNWSGGPMVNLVLMGFLERMENERVEENEKRMRLLMDVWKNEDSLNQQEGNNERSREKQGRGEG